MTREIELTKGHKAIVDDEDYEWLSKFKWHAATSNEGGYVCAARWQKLDSGKRRYLRMATAIMETTGLRLAGLEVDHISRHSLDNRRLNLRVVTKAENCRNKGHYRNNTSGVKGVSWNAETKNWRASKKIDGRLKHIGLFPSIEEAKAAYDALA